ncbi:MAG: hypothetical protein JSU82_12250 [Rhodospirillales bacterium]|nr:MAG: hypothetical protein JSU82_12250 [Rhodospirillales bacterium]
MQRQIRWLKASFLAGATADFGIGILTLIPARMGESTVTYPMGLASTLMFGWTVLLLWGYRDPVARRGLLVITIFPVITGLMASGVYAVAAGIFPVVHIVPSTILGLGLIALMGYSYLAARGLESRSETERQVDYAGPESPVTPQRRARGADSRRPG